VLVDEGASDVQLRAIASLPSVASKSHESLGAGAAAVVRRVVADAAGKPLLVGDTSTGYGCALLGYPGIYGRVPSFRSFVDDTIGWHASGTPSTTALHWQRAGSSDPSAPQTVTLTNSGDAPLAVAGVTLGGGDAAGFKLTADGSQCTGFRECVSTSGPHLSEFEYQVTQSRRIQRIRCVPIEMDAETRGRRDFG
jgi:hypothetical protein